MGQRPIGVFAYGTLKQGERNFPTAQRGGWVRSERAWLEGFQMYSLPHSAERSYPYPALAQGEGKVWGEVQYFANLEQALVLLDELEEVGKEYLRLEAQAYIVPDSQMPDFLPTIPVWVYVYPSAEALKAAGGVFLPEGTWPGAEAGRTG